MPRLIGVMCQAWMHPTAPQNISQPPVQRMIVQYRCTGALSSIVALAGQVPQANGLYAAVVHLYPPKDDDDDTVVTR